MFRELAGQAIQHGSARLALFQAYIPAVDWRRVGRPVHCRHDYPGGCSLYGNGLCLELSDAWRRGVHAGPGLGERSTNARALRADRAAACHRSLIIDCAVHGSGLRRDLLHRRAERCLNQLDRVGRVVTVLV